jgi:methionine-rich copper-binding protein CopC
MSDTVGADASSAVALQPSDSITYQGTIDAPGGVDWYSISLAAGQSYDLRVLGLDSAAGTLANPFLSIRDSTGKVVMWIDDRDAHDPSVIFTPVVAGTYYLCVEDVNPQDTGSYTLEVTKYTPPPPFVPTPDSTQPLVVGGTYVDHLGEPGDETDSTHVNLVKGVQYVFTLDFQTGDDYFSFWPSGELYDANGNFVQSLWRGSTIFVAPTTGTYTLNMLQYEPSTGQGEYAVSLDVQTSDGPLSVQGEALAILKSGDSKLYTFKPAQSGTYSFLVHGGPALAPHLEIYTANGQLACFGDYGGQSGYVQFQASKGETYYVRLHSDGDEDAGTFMLDSQPSSGNPDTVAASLQTTAVLDIGSSYAGRIDYSNDVDWVAVQLTAGHGYVFEAHADAGDYPLDEMRLRDAQGDALIPSSRADGLMQYTAALTGTYYIEVQATQPGGYTVSAFAVPAGDDRWGPLLVDTSPANWDPNVPVSTNITLTFNEDVLPGAGVIELRTVAGTVVETFDVATSNRIQVSGKTVVIDPSADLHAGTTYDVVVQQGAFLDTSKNMSGAGLANFTVGSPSPFDPGPYSMGQAVAVAVGDSQWAHSVGGPWFSVQLAAGQTYAFTVTGAGGGAIADPAIDVYDATGNLLASADDTATAVETLANFVPSASGTYYVKTALGASADGFPDGAVLQVSTSGIDKTPPKLVNSTPPGGTTHVQSDGLITATFSETIQRGAGTISLVDDSGHTIESFDAKTSSRIKITGATLTVDPANLPNDSTLHLQFTADALRDVAGNSLAATQTPGFTTLYVDQYPDNRTTTGHVEVGGSVSSRIETYGDSDWFSVQLQTGHSYRFAITGTDPDVRPSVGLYSTVAGAWIGGANTDDSNWPAYSVTFQAAFDTSLYVTVGASFETPYTLTVIDDPSIVDTTPPFVISGNTLGISPEHAVIPFSASEQLKGGAGTISIEDASRHVIQTFSGSDTSHVVIDGLSVVIKPSVTLQATSPSYVHFGDGALIDLAGNPFVSSFDYFFYTGVGGSHVVGTNAGEWLSGGGGDDTVESGAGNDQLFGESGDDLLSGGDGVDVAYFLGNFTGVGTNSSFVQNSDGTVVVTSPDGEDTLVGVERMHFSDVNVALDIEGNAGQAYRLYQAAFDRTPDLPGLGYQMNALDIGLTLLDVAQNFINSPEFSATYGSLDNTQFVTQLYANVLHRLPDAGGLAYHVARLDSGAPRSAILVGFSESPENKAAVIGAIEHGMEYLPY